MSTYLVDEDIEGNFCSLLLYVLDEQCDLHCSPHLVFESRILLLTLDTPHLTTNGGDASLVSLQGAHVDAVLDDQRRYRDQGKDQHVQDEQLLATV